MNYTNDIENYLNKYLDKVNDSKVKEAIAYSLLAGGKRIRPNLFCIALNSYGIDHKEYLNLACSLEMIHTYSLIHDDLPAMDDDDYRRGKKSCHKQFDEATAILAGDSLLTDAFYLASKSNNAHIIKVLAQCAGSNGMIYGQALDIANENIDTIDLIELEKINFYKTGCLLSAPFEMACIIANDLNNLYLWQNIGYKLGLAFQIQDDILDVTGNFEQIGKKVGSDQDNNKITYVNMIGIQRCQSLVQVLFSEIYEILEQINVNYEELKQVLEQIKNRTK